MQPTTKNLLDELWEMSGGERETIVLELSMGTWGEPMVFGYELEGIQERITRCLQKAKIPNIKSTPAVKHYKQSEIIFELEWEDEVGLNKKRGDRFRDAVGEALKNCPELFDQVRVEGDTGADGKLVQNRVDTKVRKARSGIRLVDLQLRDKLSGQPVNIETKRGASRYTAEQKRKDDWMARHGKGDTYVVRGEKIRKNREW